MTIPTTAHVAVVDLGFGDAGKGTIVDWLCASRPVHAVIRFNGGAQAGHNVVVPGRGSHTFAQFGAGTLRGVPTFLSRFMVADPLSLTVEADHLRTLGVPDAYALLTADPDVLVSTPFHRLANQARERARGTDRHGSCGMGVGETVAYALAHPTAAVRVRDLAGGPGLRRKLLDLRDFYFDTLGQPAEETPLDHLIEVYAQVAARITIAQPGHLESLLRGGQCVFEGAQGVLLDEWRGFHPYTTWSTTTFDNVAELTGDFYRLGVLRTFTTRHGAGPLVTEDATLTASHADPHNSTGPWQGPFRVGHFDAVAHRYAVSVAGGVDGLALTHLDRSDGLRVCRAYRIGGEVVGHLEPGPFRDLNHQQALTDRLQCAKPVVDAAPADWPAEIGDLVGAPVVVRSCGPTADDKVET